jgi:hypothetical protein
MAKLSDDDVRARLGRQSRIGQSFVSAALSHYLGEHEGRRSAFPAHMHDELARRAIDAFCGWVAEHADDAEMTAESASEQFDAIIHAEAMAFACNEEERLRILLPDAPRVGDSVTFHAEQGPQRSRIVERALESDGKGRHLRVVVALEAGGTWETSFELASE